MKKIPVALPSLTGNERRYLLDCFDSSWISSNGKYLSMFESEFSKYIGTKNAVACCNGTAALHLALLACGITEGDEVIVPTLTYVATANAVTYTGAKVILADCEEDTWNLDVDGLDGCITPRTKAIVVVHLYGHPCDMDRIIEFARKHDIYIIEDAAEALGSMYESRLCGTFGDIATFSFYGNKTLTTGEGGMVVTNNDKLAERARLFAGQGMDIQKRYWFPVIGYNYRMTNMQAAVGLAQLEQIEQFLVKRRKIADWYNSELVNIPGITLTCEKDYAWHSYWMYSVLINEGYGRTRDQVMDYLDQTGGVETRPFFYPMHIMPAHSRSLVFNNKGRAERISRTGINLPTHVNMEVDDVRYVSRLVREFCAA